MDPQYVIDSISRIVHISTAIAVAGGSVFMLLVLLPAAQKLSNADHDTLRQAINQKWKRFVHIGTLLFLVTGFYNFYRAIPLHKGDGLYHQLMGIKIILALVIFFIAAVLVGRSPKFESMRQARAKWLSLIVILATTIVVISGALKVRGPKSEPVRNISTSSTQ